jgi:hypothetical protein
MPASPTSVKLAMCQFRDARPADSIDVHIVINMLADEAG